MNRYTMCSLCKRWSCLEWPLRTVAHGIVDRNHTVPHYQQRLRLAQSSPEVENLRNWPGAVRSKYMQTSEHLYFKKICERSLIYIMHGLGIPELTGTDRLVLVNFGCSREPLIGPNLLQTRTKNRIVSNMDPDTGKHGWYYSKRDTIFLQISAGWNMSFLIWLPLTIIRYSSGYTYYWGFDTSQATIDRAPSSL
jgi:hypothetical protein